MTTKTKAASRILEGVHETARDLHDAGFIDMRRMQRYDALCLSHDHGSLFTCNQRAVNLRILEGRNSDYRHRFPPEVSKD